MKTFHLKEFPRISPFCLINTISAMGIVAVAIRSAMERSFPTMVFGTVLIVCVHQMFYLYGMFVPASEYFLEIIRGKDYFGDQEGVLFRFDDGPHPVYTPQILDVLKSEGISAIFAVTGKNAVAHPEIMERIRREGHEIANHTYSHPYNILLLGYRRVRDEIDEANTAIQKITGMRPEYFCPPMGQMNPIIGKALKDLGLKSMMWDIRTFDTVSSYERTMKLIRRKLKPGSIIVFHDGLLPWSKDERDSTVLALKETIKLIKQGQYVPERVEESKSTVGGVR